MRKRVIIAALAIIAMSSCNKEQVEIESSAICAQFTSSIESRASGTEWEVGDAVGIIVTQNGSPLSSYHYNNRHNVVIGSNASICSFEADSELDQIYYSTDESTTIDFYGYYPYSADIDATEQCYPIDVTHQSSPQSIDLMVASTEGGSGYNKNSDAVSLRFNRCMTKISLQLKAGTGVELTDISAVKITGFYTKANYSFESGSFVDLSAEEATITPYLDESGVYSAILIPNNTLNHIIYFTTPYGDVPLDLSDESLLAGEHNYYTVNVHQTSTTYQSNSINNWNTAWGEDLKTE